MQQVKIYIETDSSSPKATEKHYGYVLEVMVSGQAVTREGFGKITGTYHQTVLTALAKALDRFNQSCEVCICTEDDFVLNMLERNLAIWAGNEFLTSKRKPVANQQEWMEIWRLSNRHMYLGRHNKGETYILMLRFKAEPDIPYITVEIDAKNPRILQWYGDKDKKPDEKNMQSWLNTWLMKLKTGTLTETIQTAAIA